MITDFQRIKNVIERELNVGKRNFIIYPYGEYGTIAKQILNDSFGIKEKYIVDNKLCNYNHNIKKLDCFKDLDNSGYTVLFTCANPDVYQEARDHLKRYFLDSNIVDIFTDVRNGGIEQNIHYVANIAMDHYAIIGW